MPVVFNTSTSHRVIMLDKDAAMMLKAMHTSGSIPGALYAEALPDALKALETRIKLESHEENSEQTEANEHIGIHTRAFPLIELIESAIEKDETLMWNEG